MVYLFVLYVNVVLHHGPVHGVLVREGQEPEPSGLLLLLKQDKVNPNLTGGTGQDRITSTELILIQNNLYHLTASGSISEAFNASVTVLLRKYQFI